MSRKKAIILGTGAFAESVDFLLTHDSDYDVVAFTASADHVSVIEFLGRPLLEFENIEKKFSPSTHEMFVAIGYTKLNSIREKFADAAFGKGFRLLTYICSKATTWPDLKIGKNCFVFEDNTIQPFVNIEDNTVLWSGNHVGHHSRIGPNCFVTSHVVISGNCVIGSHSFIGVNASISEGVTIGERNLIGPGTLIQKSTGPDEAYIAERTEKYPKPSGRFFR